MKIVTQGARFWSRSARSASLCAHFIATVSLMRHLPSCLALLCGSSLGMLVAGPAAAFDLSTQGIVASGYVTSKITTAPFDRKLLLAARDDAAAFVASDGKLRAARLEVALRYLRDSRPGLRASDSELAQAILAE
jgi:uncharacterized protein (TIGR02448 family)